MPRPRVEDRGFSSLKLKRKRNMAYCYCFGKPWYFGPWDQESDKPTVAAEVAFLRQVQQWAADPEAAAKEVIDQGLMSRVTVGRCSFRCGQTGGLHQERSTPRTGYWIPARSCCSWAAWLMG